jgi:drug/metabolite transporter (DMT)-like permease
MRFSRFTLKNALFVALIVISNTVGNVLLGIGMRSAPDFEKVALGSYLLRLSLNPWILAGIALLIVWMIAQLSMLSWADLSYVLPITASAYILTAILGKFFLQERISLERWIGIAVISFGVTLVSETPPKTSGEVGDKHP